MLKKIFTTASIGVCALSLCMNALADSQTWNIVPLMSTNLLPAPMKVTAITIVGTNAVTISLYDSPNTGLTNYTPAYSNIIHYGTNINVIWTNFFGASNGYILSNSLIAITNSNPAATNFFTPVGTWSVLSNSTLTIPNLSGAFNNGVVVSNQTANNTATVTLQYTGN